MSEPPEWHEWIDSHGAQLVLFARRWALDHAEAEDFVQEAFVKFWRSRTDVRDPVAYLYRCVRSVAHDASRNRKARIRRETLSFEQQASTALFQCPMELDERRVEIERAFGELSDDQAEVLTLKIWSELTFAQIATVTNSSVATVASRYRYAVKHLRRILAESPST